MKKELNINEKNNDIFLCFYHDYVDGLWQKN